MRDLPVNVPMMQDLRLLGGTTVVNASGATGLSPVVVGDLCRIPSIKRLWLMESDITDEGLNLLWRKLPELEFITLSETGISDDGLKDAGAARELQTLNLAATRVTDRTVAELRELPKLEVLLLNGTQITEESSSVLARMPVLSVSISPTEIGVLLREKLQALRPTIDAN